MDESKIYKYGKDITWSLPLLFEFEPAWGMIYKSFKNWGVNLPQINAFGSPILAWTGGRAPAIHSELTSRVILALFNYLKEINAVPSLTFTYTGLTKEDLKDRYANYFLDIALEAGAHFIIYSDLLKNYIKEKDPNAYVVASVVKPAFMFQGSDRLTDHTIEKETELYNNLLKEYDLVVVRPEYSKGALLENPNLIDDISRIEVLINQPCIHNCPRMPAHYKHLESLRFGPTDGKNFDCIKRGFNDDNKFFTNTLCHDEQTVKKLVSSGVKHLKLQGRGVGTAIDMHALSIFSQMFQTGGPNYLLAEKILQNYIRDEAEYFKSLVNG